MSDPRHRQWLDEAIQQCPSDIQDDARELLKPFLRHCRSNSRHRFWIALRLFLANPRNDAKDLLAFVSESKCSGVTVTLYKVDDRGGQVCADWCFKSSKRN